MNFQSTWWFYHVLTWGREAPPANRWQFLFCIRIENFERAHTGQTFLEISNSWKTVRMAPILTIFGPNESQRCQLNFAKFSRCRKSFREDENFKKLSRKVRKSLSCVRFCAKNKIETAICFKRQSSHWGRWRGWICSIWG